jgi:hypothetical protein
MGIMNTRCFIIVFNLLWIVPMWAISATISGSVMVQTGRPIRASLSIHDLSTPRTAGHKPDDHQFASKADGSFSLAGVPAGKYRICVDAPQENVLDPCLWSDTQQTWTLADRDNLTLGGVPKGLSSYVVRLR